MWMEVHIYSSFNAKNWSGNMWVKDIMTTFFWPKPKENQLGILKISAFARKFSRGPQVQEKVLLGLCIYLWEYTQKVAASSPEKLPQLYLVVQERVQLEHSRHIFRVGFKATC